MTRPLRAVLTTVIALTFSSLAGALTLDVRGGELYGAFGVPVDGYLYNVEFVDGTCADLFDGCDDPADFQFRTAQSGSDASKALLDFVFDDNEFDYRPNLTRGCSGSPQESCMMLTPVFPGMYDTFWFAYAINRPTNWDPSFGCCAGFSIFEDMTQNPGSTTVFARWTLVPEPTTIALLAAAGGAWWGLRRSQLDGATRRRTQRQQTTCTPNGH